MSGRMILAILVVLVLAYLFLTMTKSGRQVAGNFPFPVPPLFGVNRGGGVPGL